MSYPKEIKVGSVVFHVTEDKKIWKKVCKKGKVKRNLVYGRTDPIKGIIYLNPNQDEDVKRLTIWHEVYHGILAHVTSPTDWRNLGSEPDETVVQVFDSSTLLVLRDNPELVKYLTD